MAIPGCLLWVLRGLWRGVQVSVWSSSQWSGSFQAPAYTQSRLPQRRRFRHWVSDHRSRKGMEQWGVDGLLSGRAVRAPLRWVSHPRTSCWSRVPHCDSHPLGQSPERAEGGSPQGVSVPSSCEQVCFPSSYSCIQGFPGPWTAPWFPGGHAVGSFQALSQREGTSHEGATLPLLWCFRPHSLHLFRAPGKWLYPPSFRRAVMGKIRAPPTNAALAVPATLSWEGHQHLVQAMIDSGAAGDFLDLSLAKELGIPTQLLPRPQAVMALDGRSLEPGRVTEATQSLRLTIHQHQQEETFYLIDSPEYPVILGHPWLRRHNPWIDWSAGTILS